MTVVRVGGLLASARSEAPAAAGYELHDDALACDENRSGAVMSAAGGMRPSFAALTASNAFTRP